MSRRWEGTGLLAQTTILLSTETLGRRQTEARISPMVPTRDQEPRSVPGAGGGAVPPLESGDCDFGWWWRAVYSVLYCAWLLDNYYACCLFLPGFCEICQEICVGFARNKCCHI